jgi:ABC-type transport system involved in multi-copper enzyme maturation permease subunit
MGSNPVLGQELRRVLRHGRSFLVLAVYVATLAGVIAVVYPHEGIALYHGRNPSEVGRTIFEAFTRAQFILVLLLVPVLAAPALTVEKEKRTLESLLVSGLTPYQIVLGKFYGSLLYVSLLLTASVPLTAAVCSDARSSSCARFTS